MFSVVWDPMRRSAHSRESDPIRKPGLLGPEAHERETSSGHSRTRKEGKPEEDSERMNQAQITRSSPGVAAHDSESSITGGLVQKSLHGLLCVAQSAPLA